MAQDREGREDSTLQSPTVHPPAERVFAYVLRVESGPDKGKSLVVDGSEPGGVYLGKSAACHLTLADPTVSRRHASLVSEPAGLRVTDLGSKNATFVNGVAVVEAWLHGGEVLRLGETLLRVTASEAAAPSPPLPGAVRFGRMIGGSPEMRRLYPLCERLALSDLPIVIEGETGTGKELLAEAIHEAGPRASGPFVVFDCTTAPSTLIESMLFGHERGAFTGATAARVGVFEQAHEGTLLIDEIGDLDVALQAKLLRAVERGEVQRIGASAWTKADVRVVAATRRDLEQAIVAGRFRDDLYYRLASARIVLPPLRRRRGDLPLLASHFWRSLAPSSTLPRGLLDRYDGYGWPGNVRELHNVVAHHFALGGLADPASMRRSTAPPAEGVEGGSDPVGRAAPDVVEALIAARTPFTIARQEVLADFERRYVAAVLAREGGNVSKAAAASGIARRYFTMVRSRTER